MSLNKLVLAFYFFYTLPLGPSVLNEWCDRCRCRESYANAEYGESITHHLSHLEGFGIHWIKIGFRPWAKPFNIAEKVDGSV